MYLGSLTCEAAFLNEKDHLNFHLESLRNPFKRLTDAIQSGDRSYTRSWHREQSHSDSDIGLSPDDISLHGQGESKKTSLGRRSMTSPSARLLEETEEEGGEGVADEEKGTMR